MKVYFIVSCGDPMRMKIGFAKNPSKRLEDLQVGNPNTLELVAIVECKSEMHAREIERRAHEDFAKQHIRGEWFQYNKLTAKRVNRWVWKQTNR